MNDLRTDAEFLRDLADIADDWRDFYSSFDEGDAERLRAIAEKLAAEE